MATTEVAKALEALDFLQEVNVYGVTVPGAQAWEVWGDTRPASLNWYNGRRGQRPRGQPLPLSLSPPPTQDTKAELEWQPWFHVPPTLWTLGSSTPMFLRTCHLMPGLGS